MTTIGKLGAQFGLSRSTLLYYDRIGLLSPSERAPNGYRRYSDADAKRLARICTYRKAGLSLSDIGRILDDGDGQVSEILERRLSELSEEMEAVRRRQRFVISLLKEPEVLARRSGPMDKESWSNLLRDAGFTDADMVRWHRQFEREAPEKHRRFLSLLGIPEEEIDAIRRYSRKSNRGGRSVS
jgi:DNA-binding transcriptional MerR regulator